MNFLTHPAIIAQLNDLGIKASQIRKVNPFAYTLEWSGSTPGTTNSTSFRVDNGAPFLITRTAFRAFNTAAYASSLAYSTLPRNGSQSQASQMTMPSIDAIRLELSDQNGSWQDKPVRAANVCGTDENEMSDAPRVLGGGITVNGNLYYEAGTGATIGAQLTFRGFRLFV